MKNQILFILLTSFTFVAQMGHAQDMPCPDAMPAKANMDKKANMVDTLELKEFCDIFDEDQSNLTIERNDDGPMVLGHQVDNHGHGHQHK